MIVGIGELLWDVFPDGRRVAGGAPFNFAFHCRQLGHDAVIVSRVGDDEPGRDLRAEVRRLGLTDEWIPTDPDHPTGTVRVSVDPAGQPTYTIAESVAWDHIAWTPALEELAATAAVVCHGTLALRSPTSRATITRMDEESRKSILPSVRVLDVNLRPPFTDPNVLRQAVLEADWVKVNADEWLELGRVLDRAGSAELATWHRVHGAGDGAVWLVTHGEGGAEVSTTRRTHREPGVPTRVVDAVGAGDAFTAAVVCLHLEGRPMGECVRFANHYAARVCEHRGATPHLERATLERAAFGRSP